MATTKELKSIKKTLYKAILYVTNPNKTDHHTLISTLGGCSTNPKLAFQQMRMTKSLCNQKGGVQAHHFIQNFNPGELSPELAHQIGVEWMKKNLGDEYECIISTHVDKGHIHNHILFNSVNKVTGKKFDNHGKYWKWRKENDKICKDYGLSIPDEFKRSKEEKTSQKNINDKRKESLRDYKNSIKDDIDSTIYLSNNFDDFISKMQAQGYTIRHGDNITHISFKKGEHNPIRDTSLGSEYSEKSIKNRIKMHELYKHCEADPAKGTVLEIKNFIINKELSTDELLCIKIPKQDTYFYYLKREALYQNWQSYKILLKPSEIYNKVDKSGHQTPPLTCSELSKIFDAAQKETIKNKEQKTQKNDYKNKRYSTKTQSYEPYKKYKVSTGRKVFKRFKSYNKYSIPYRNYNIYGYRKPTFKNSILLTLVKYLVEKNHNQKVFQQTNSFKELHEAENKIKVLKNNISNTLNILDLIEKNKINNIKDIKTKTTEIEEKISQNYIKIKAVEGKLVEKKALLKLTDEYIKLKPAYKEYKLTKIRTADSEKFKEVYHALMNFNIQTESQILEYRKKYDDLIEDLKNEIIDIEYENRSLRNKKGKLETLENNVKDFKTEKQKDDNKNYSDFQR